MAEVPEIREHEGILVVRDDLFPGGTKARVLPAILNGAREFVYASPAYGYAQVALAYTCRALQRQAVICVAQRSRLHPRTAEARRASARIIEVPHGYMANVQKQARTYASLAGATLLPFGFDTPAFLSGLAAIARALPVKPQEVWCAAGSGTLARALHIAWPQASIHAVRVGSLPVLPIKAIVYTASEKFEDDAKVRPPFPSCSNYDAKVWQFIRKYAKPGALFWNVAG